MGATSKNDNSTMNKLTTVIITIAFGALALGGIGVWLSIKAGSETAQNQTQEPGTSVAGERLETDNIIVNSPRPGDTISSPLEITGQATGRWYFEASFPVTLKDANGKIIAQTPAQAEGEWMTEEFVPFKGTLAFTAPSTETGELIFEKDNPSGLPEFDEKVTMPVRFAPTAAPSASVKIFFGKTGGDKGEGAFECNQVTPVERDIIPTQQVARAALEELFKGPTDEEKEQGYLTSINPGVKIQALSITDGTARVDLSKELDEQIGGSCRVSAIRAQITETLKQFPTVREVIISVDGRTEDILQP